MKATVLAMVALLVGGTRSMPPPAQSQARTAEVATVATYLPGTFLENLSVGPDGRLAITSYSDRRLLSWSGARAPTLLVTLDAHPVGILSRRADMVVSAHGASFTDGPAFTATNRMLVLDRAGKVLSTTPVPQAKFLNGMVELAPDVILVADSLAGTIWRFNPATGAMAAWMSDPAFAVDPAAGSQGLGANGLKIRGGYLYVSNTSRGRLYRVRLRGRAPSGPVETFATTGSVDDFAFLADGSIAVTTHNVRLLRVGRDGKVSEIIGAGCNACTSVTPFGRRGELIVLTTGGVPGTPAGPARILRVRAPAPLQ